MTVACSSHSSAHLPSATGLRTIPFIQPGIRRLSKTPIMNSLAIICIIPICGNHVRPTCIHGRGFKAGFMTVTDRACASSSAVFTIIWSVLALMGVAALCKTGQPSLWQPVAICVRAGIFAAVWLSRYRLEFADDSLAYRSLFSRERRMNRSEIVFADFAERTGPFESPLTFVIRTASEAEIRVNARVFSREAVRALVGLAATSRTVA